MKKVNWNHYKIYNHEPKPQITAKQPKAKKKTIMMSMKNIQIKSYIDMITQNKSCKKSC